jgi:ABC-type transporter MlaC component
MRTINVLLIALLLVLASAFSHAAQRAQPTTSPASVIREVYKVHDNGKGGIFEAKGKKYLYRFFDQQLADLIWKDISQTPEGELGNLDFDPLYNAQDTGITNFQIGKPLVEGNTATVLVTFRNFGQRTRIKFEMRNRESGWKIKNVIYDKSDLITILSP